MDSLPSPPVCVPRAPDPVTEPTAGGQPTISPSVCTTCTRPCNRTHCWWTAYHLPQSHVVVPVKHTVPSIVAGSPSDVAISGPYKWESKWKYCVCVFMYVCARTVCVYVCVCVCAHVHACGPTCVKLQGMWKKLRRK